MSGNHVKIAARYGQPGETLSEITRLRAAIRQLAFHAPAGRRDPVARRIRPSTGLARLVGAVQGTM